MGKSRAFHLSCWPESISWPSAVTPRAGDGESAVKKALIPGSSSAGGWCLCCKGREEPVSGGREGAEAGTCLEAGGWGWMPEDRSPPSRGGAWGLAATTRATEVSQTLQPGLGGEGGTDYQESALSTAQCQCLSTQLAKILGTILGRSI